MPPSIKLFDFIKHLVIISHIKVFVKIKNKLFYVKIRILATQKGTPIGLYTKGGVSKNTAHLERAMPYFAFVFIKKRLSAKLTSHRLISRTVSLFHKGGCYRSVFNIFSTILNLLEQFDPISLMCFSIFVYKFVF